MYNSTTKETQFNFSASDLTTLKIAIDAGLARHNVCMRGTVVISHDKPFHPSSHVGTLIDLACRVDRARHGEHFKANRRGLANYKRE